MRLRRLHGFAEARRGLACSACTAFPSRPVAGTRFLLPSAASVRNRRQPEQPRASDGSAGAERAVELAARIGYANQAAVYMLSVDPGPHGEPTRTAVEAADLTTALGREPTVVRESGEPSERILELAVGERVALVVLGSRGLTGVRALGSVSERVAHRAPCSVLVARSA
jgi:nucleotide-binding universal stress UspA family protein